MGQDTPRWLKKLYCLFPPRAEEIGQSDKSPEGVDPVVSVREIGVGDVMEHELGIQRPLGANEITEAQAGLGGKLDLLADGILRFVLVDVVVNESGSALYIGNKPGIRPDEIVTKQRCQAHQIVP